jgi:hypothetical protein
MFNAALRERARAKLKSGELPAAGEIRLWAGPGLDMPCALCEQPITRADVEYEIELLPSDTRIRFHPVCRELWELERIVWRDRIIRDTVANKSNRHNEHTGRRRIA